MWANGCYREHSLSCFIEDILILKVYTIRSVRLFAVNLESYCWEQIGGVQIIAVKHRELVNQDLSIRITEWTKSEENWPFFCRKQSLLRYVMYFTNPSLSLPPLPGGCCFQSSKLTEYKARSSEFCYFGSLAVEGLIHSRGQHQKMLIRFAVGMSCVQTNLVS